MTNSQLVIQLIMVGIQNLDKLMALFHRAQSENRDITDQEVLDIGISTDQKLAAAQAWIDSKKVTT